MKPVLDDSKNGWYASNKSVKQISDKMLEMILKEQRNDSNVTMDTALDCITSFEYQKELLINSRCINKLEYPDSADLQNLYFNSIYSTSIVTKNHVSFIRKYDKNILNYGLAKIFEYSLAGPAVNPHFLSVIIKIKNNDDQDDDYKGFAISSDSLSWKDSKDGLISLPIFIKNTRTKSVYIPLVFHGGKFIPIGVLKITE
jgi:hypothetical protein